MATATTRFSGRTFSAREMTLIRDVVRDCPGLSRMELARTVCELLRWRRPNGRLKARECREFLERLDTDGALALPDKRLGRAPGSVTRVPRTAAGEPGRPLAGSVRDIEPLSVEAVREPAERLLFRELVGRYHYLGHTVPSWHRTRPGHLGTRAFQGVMVLFIVIGGAGVWFHYGSNAAFELSLHPSMAGWEAVREFLSGPAPAIAPSAMVQLGLLGLTYTYRHPFLERRPSRAAAVGPLVVAHGSSRGSEVGDRRGAYRDREPRDQAHPLDGRHRPGDRDADLRDSAFPRRLEAAALPRPLCGPSPVDARGPRPTAGPATGSHRSSRRGRGRSACVARNVCDVVPFPRRVGSTAVAGPPASRVRPPPSTCSRMWSSNQLPPDPSSTCTLHLVKLWPGALSSTSCT